LPVEWFSVLLVIRRHGAPSIAQGITPHEVRDEMCRSARPGRAAG
jgi:hypothetical protein